jgi:hypothetical protein
MFKLDNNFLIELGLGALPAEEKNKMLAHIYETLEMRVGMKLAEQMTDAQLDEFESYINRNDEAGALNWLESNFPNYKDVVAAELEKLKNEIRTVAPQIVAESMNNANAASAAPQQVSAPQAPAAGQYAAPAPMQQPMPQQPVQPQPQYQQPNQPYQPQPQPGMGVPQQPLQPYQPPMSPQQPQQPQQPQPYQYPQPPVPPQQ